MTELCRLAQKYGTDKVHYTPFYSLLLEGRRQTTHRVLEIGIGTPKAMQHVPGYKPGASLRMWKEYFPNAVIDGVDIEHIPNVQEERINVWIADQRSKGDLWSVANDVYDLIVDDGSHIVEDQIFSFGELFPLLRRGGIYIIEDVNKPEALSSLLTVPHSVVQVMSFLTGRCIVVTK